MAEADGGKIAPERLAALGIDRVVYRTLPAAFRGVVCVWDVDKTYLDTPFDSLRGLLKIPFELAVDKRAFPGTPQVLKELRRGPGRRPRQTPLFFVSASPPVLRPVLERKMLLDGVECDGLMLKDPGRAVRQSGLRGLKLQIAYKLGALLQLGAELPRGARELLFGDDMESDALIYELYAEIVAGRLRDDALAARLGEHGVPHALAATLTELAGRTPGRKGVEGIYIHLARGTDPAALAGDHPTVIPVRDSLQTALSLAAAGHVSTAGVARVAERLRQEGAGEGTVVESVLDAIRRRLHGGPALDELLEALRRAGVTPPEITFHAHGSPGR